MLSFRLPARSPSPRLPADAGIALGPILFVLGILAVIGVVLSAGSGGFNTASVADRVAADVQTQANLIRTKISECNLLYGTNNNWDGFPASGGVSVDVSTVNCTGDPAGSQSIWSGLRPTNLPPPTSGFNDWEYINTNSVGLAGTAAGGRCIWIQPTKSSGGITAGLTNAAKKFTHNTVNDGASEINYDPSKAGQRFVVWISAPPAAGLETADCKPQ